MPSTRDTSNDHFVLKHTFDGVDFFYVAPKRWSDCYGDATPIKREVDADRIAALAARNLNRFREASEPQAKVRVIAVRPLI